jgi:hypothetical protein
MATSWRHNWRQPANYGCGDHGSGYKFVYSVPGEARKPSFCPSVGVRLHQSLAMEALWKTKSRNQKK